MVISKSILPKTRQRTEGWKRVREGERQKSEVG